MAPSLLTSVDKTQISHSRRWLLRIRWPILTVVALFIVSFVGFIFLHKYHDPAVTQTIPESSEKVALVIGNSNYRYVPRLNTADRDAHDLADKLSRMGFKLILQTNESKEASQAAIERFIERSNGSKIAMFLYFGHGVAVNGVNYLVPIDAKIHHDTDIPGQSVNLNNFIESVQVKNKFGALLFILDTCTKNISLPSVSAVTQAQEEPRKNSSHGSPVTSVDRNSALSKKINSTSSGPIAKSSTATGRSTPENLNTESTPIPMFPTMQIEQIRLSADTHLDAGTSSNSLSGEKSQMQKATPTNNESKKDADFHWQGSDSYFHTGKPERMRGLDSLLGTFTPYIENSLIKILSDNVMIIYSSQPDENAIDQLAGITNSPFAHALLINIESKGQPLAVMLDHVRRTVFEITQGRQQPWLRGTLTKDIYLAGH